VLDNAPQRAPTVDSRNAIAVPGQVADQQIALGDIILDHNDMRALVHARDLCS
jgi:hypothetical protein